MCTISSVFCQMCILSECIQFHLCSVKCVLHQYVYNFTCVLSSVCSISMYTGSPVFCQTCAPSVCIQFHLCSVKCVLHQYVYSFTCVLSSVCSISMYTVSPVFCQLCASLSCIQFHLCSFKCVLHQYVYSVCFIIMYSFTCVLSSVHTVSPVSPPSVYIQYHLFSVKYVLHQYLCGFCVSKSHRVPPDLRSSVPVFYLACDIMIYLQLLSTSRYFCVSMCLIIHGVYIPQLS